MEKEKLKTLKEIISKINAWDKIWVEEEELRANAVKWVKYFEEEDTIDRLDKNAYFIKHFFNLTEEDLELKNALSEDHSHHTNCPLTKEVKPEVKE